MSNVRRVTAKEFQSLVEFAQKSHIAKKEPIPELFADNVEKIQSCLQSPFQTFGGKYLYQGFVRKAAILFYLLIKNHPLRNGNKRMAILTAGYFYYVNNRKFKVPSKELYNLAKDTAESTDKEEAVKHVTRVFNKYYTGMK